MEKNCRSTMSRCLHDKGMLVAELPKAIAHPCRGSPPWLRLSCCSLRITVSSTSLEQDPGNNAEMCNVVSMGVFIQVDTHCIGLRISALMHAGCGARCCFTRMLPCSNRLNRRAVARGQYAPVVSSLGGMPNPATLFCTGWPYTIHSSSRQLLIICICCGAGGIAGHQLQPGHAAPADTWHALVI